MPQASPLANFPTLRFHRPSSRVGALLAASHIVHVSFGSLKYHHVRGIVSSLRDLLTSLPPECLLIAVFTCLRFIFSNASVSNHCSSIHPFSLEQQRPFIWSFRRLPIFHMLRPTGLYKSFSGSDQSSPTDKTFSIQPNTLDQYQLIHTSNTNTEKDITSHCSGYD